MASIFFIELTNEQHRQLNIEGWGGELGKNFLDARAGRINEKNIDMFKHAAVMRAETAEECWLALQNGIPGNPTSAWRDNRNISCFTNQPRSMDVGDIAMVEGQAFRCASCGWEEIDFTPNMDMKMNMERRVTAKLLSAMTR